MLVVGTDKGEEMDQIHPSGSIPHIVHMYPSAVDSKAQDSQILQLSQPLSTTHPTKITYHQTITSEVSMPSSELDPHRTQIVMSCQQSQLQTLQSVSMQTQIIHADVPLQFTSHVLLPQLPVFKQHTLSEQNGAYYNEYGSYDKEQSYMSKEDSQTALEQIENNKQIDCNQDSTNQSEVQTARKRKRSRVSNPNSWACNVRKMKHQSGEAYISRRGKYVPERKIKSTKDCLTTCKLKCNKKISDTDRELIFKAFYSLTKNEKKHFLLNTTERHDVRQPKSQTNKRMNTFKYYFLVRGTRHAVCKNFYLGTLSISQKPVYNVHAGKSDLNIPKPDGRGLSPSSYHGLPTTVKDTVRDHIMSFQTADSSPIKQFSKKRQHLQGNLTVKQMYNKYLEDCANKNVYTVKQSMYRKILKQEFNIHFAKTKSEQLCAKCKEPIKKKSDSINS